MSQHIRIIIPARAARVTRHLLVACVAAVSGLVTSSSAGAATTAATFTRTDYAFLGNNHVVADFNGDGSLDVAGSGAQSAVVQLNNGAGGFGARVEYPVATWAQDLAAGDFNGDGRMDLVVTINDPQIGLSLLTGRGDGTFAPAVNFANTSGFDSPAIVAVDLNNDSKLDVVIAHQIACYTAPCRVTQLMSVMIGNGDGTFQPTRDIDVGRGMSKIAVGDFNRDGFKDLAIAGDSSRVYRVYGIGDGTFIQQPTLTLIPDMNLGMDNTDIDVGDFNGDSIQDLVVAVSLNGSKTAILIGNSDGTFQSPLLIQEPNLNVPQYQAVADYNGDGFQDLAISLGNGTQGLMELLNGNGDGTFQPLRYYLTPPPKSSISGYSIVAANLNGDSKPDITLGISGAAPAFAVLLNSTGTTPPPPPPTLSPPTLLSPAQFSTPAQPVTLDWTDVSGATSYRVQVDDSSGFSAPLVVDQTVGASRLTLPTLAAQEHWWRVQAINSAGTSSFSSVRRFTPRSAASQAATLTVTATGRSGERVASSPAGINVAVGSSGSASFATGQAITLSVSNGRSAVWSGACSSGGSKTKTCTFTFTGTVNVTANVQ